MEEDHWSCRHHHRQNCLCIVSTAWQQSERNIHLLVGGLLQLFIRGIGTQGNEMDGILNLGNENLTLGNGGKFQSIMPPNLPPQFGHPTITGTTVVCPPTSVVIHVFSVKAVFVDASVEASLGATVSVEVILFELLGGGTVVFSALRTVAVLSIMIALAGPDANAVGIENVWLAITSGGPPDVMVVLAAAKPTEGISVSVIP